MKTRTGRFCFTLLAATLLLGIVRPASADSELWVGAARAEITPEQPVALTGQRHLRVAEEAETPLYATALAIEGRRDGEIVDQAVLVACDLVAIRGGLLERVRERAAEALPDLDPAKLLLNATHTHTAPVLTEGRYAIPDDQDIMPPAAYVEFAAEQVIEAVSEAWEGRRRATVSWGIDHARVAYNRRAVYADGTARMYGATDGGAFRRIEGPEDQAVESLFFWDAEDGQELIATTINIAAPSQQVEHLSTLHADFWHPIRTALWQRHGEDVQVVPWTGAAGDQSPRPMFRKEAEQRMRALRGGDRLDELARRVVRAWEDTYEVVQHDQHRRAAFAHQVHAIELTPRQIAEAEYARAKSRVDALGDSPDQQWNRRWHQSVVDRYEQQQDSTQEPYQMELHVLRIGDVAVATNDFELFTDFGVQIKARSPALQTFVIQLAGAGSYVPTEAAVRGGGYSAIAESSTVGPQGGQELVDQTVDAVEALWDKTPEQ